MCLSEDDTQCIVTKKINKWLHSWLASILGIPPATKDQEEAELKLKCWKAELGKGPSFCPLFASLQIRQTLVCHFAKLGQCLLPWIKVRVLVTKPNRTWDRILKRVLMKKNKMLLCWLMKWTKMLHAIQQLIQRKVKSHPELARHPPTEEIFMMTEYTLAELWTLVPSCNKRPGKVSRHS